MLDLRTVPGTLEIEGWSVPCTQVTNVSHEEK